MYDNIGRKIKTLAQVLAFLDLFASFIIGAYLLNMDIGIGLFVIIFGPIVGWISSWVMYGFGEIIVKVTEIADNTTKNTLNNTVNITEHSNTKQGFIVCSVCGNIMQIDANNNYPSVCTHCGKTIKY